MRRHCSPDRGGRHVVGFRTSALQFPLHATAASQQSRHPASGAEPPNSAPTNIRGTVARRPCYLCSRLRPYQSRADEYVSSSRTQIPLVTAKGLCQPAAASRWRATFPALQPLSRHNQPSFVFPQLPSGRLPASLRALRAGKYDKLATNLLLLPWKVCQSTAPYAHHCRTGCLV
jgi:hypothetical protein